MARTVELDDGDVVAFRHGLGLIAGDQVVCVFQQTGCDDRLRDAERKPCERRALAITRGSAGEVRHAGAEF